MLGSRKGDWELCAELARFLIALDGSGDMLRRAVARVGLRGGGGGGGGGGAENNHQATTTAPDGTSGAKGLGLTVPSRMGSWSNLSSSPVSVSMSSLSSPLGHGHMVDRDDVSASSGGREGGNSVNGGSISPGASSRGDI